MTKDEAKAWLHRFLDTPDELKRTCENGHKECSIDDRGPCSDVVSYHAADSYGEFKRLLPAQRRAAGKARREMGDEEHW